MTLMNKFYMQCPKQRCFNSERTMNSQLKRATTPNNFGRFVLLQFTLIHLLVLNSVTWRTQFSSADAQSFEGANHVIAQSKRSLQSQTEPSTVPTSTPITVQPTWQPTILSSPITTIPQSIRQSVTPSLTPTSNATATPTTLPSSALPRVEPTLPPTEIPTALPTVAPTLSPITENPTLDPTFNPTISPSNQPSLRPTITATFITPTYDTSNSPTLSVEGQSDPSPTFSPITESPTLLTIVLAPTATPILTFKYDKSALRVRDVTFRLHRVTKRYLQRNSNMLDSNCTETWQASIEERIEKEVMEVVQQYESLDVKLSNVLTASNATTLSMVFDVVLEIRSSQVNFIDPVRVVHAPFDSPSDRDSFIGFLKSTNCKEFHDVESLSITVPTTAEEQQPSDNGTSPAALYAAVSVAVAAILMMGITVCCCLHIRNKRRVNDNASINNALVASPNIANVQKTFDTPSIVGGRSKNSDISTLGDPIPFGVWKERNEELSSTNESCSIEYDYKKAFLDIHSITDSHMCGSVDDQISTGMSVTDEIQTTDGDSGDVLQLQLMLTALADDIVTAGGDDTTVCSRRDDYSIKEEEFEVVVPPGILGLILESNSENGRPMVYNIRPNTFLSSLVKVGDYIDIVDGVNVSTMNANDVSRLITLKQDESRVLVFRRSTKIKTFHL